MRDISTLIIGAGQAGLAMSHCLSQRSIEHVLLERGQVANSWRTERWDSLRLLTPNWQSRLPGYTYTGDQPDGFRSMPQTIDFLSGYAQQIAAPIETETTVLSVDAIANGYLVKTNRGDWTCRSVVIASGACNIARVPACAAELPADITSITPLTYRNPDQLPGGNVLVVGASATGVQLASELQRSGRQVTLATGEHVRVPRTYRGRDIKWWMDQTGIMDMTLAEVDDVRRARHVPSLQLIGSPTHETISLNSLQSIGVQIAGRVMGLSGDKVQFSGSLPNVCSLADLKMNRLLKQIDEWIEAVAPDGVTEPSYRLRETRVPRDPLLQLDLKEAGIETVIWATGFKPDYSWLNVPVVTPRGELRHQGGVVDAPGMYVLGLPFLRRRKSSLIDGVGDDARDLAIHLSAYLNGVLAEAA
nr:NAD(P)-binding domain-containing protein [Hyphomonas sp. Mor2]